MTPEVKGVNTIISRLTPEEDLALRGSTKLGRRYVINSHTTISIRMNLRRKCLLSYSSSYLTKLGETVLYFLKD